MSLYQDWTKLLNGQTESTFRTFWEEYSNAEMSVYAWILSHQHEKLEGTVAELAKKFNIREIMVMGFLDGVKSSLKDPDVLNLEAVTPDTALSIDPDFELLFRNMLGADARHLYSLPEWDQVLSAGKREEIRKDFNRSRIYHAPKKPGRNDPCPCGSGKKYKNCCMKKDQEAQRLSQA